MVPHLGVPESGRQLTNNVIFCVDPVPYKCDVEFDDAKLFLRFNSACV